MSDFTQAEFWCVPTERDQYLMIDPLRWELERKGSGRFYKVPAGFRFDVSIPRGLRRIFDPHDPRYLKAAALHDHMLSEGWDRRRAGAEFCLALRACGVGPAETFLMWFAVSVWRWK